MFKFNVQTKPVPVIHTALYLSDVLCNLLQIFFDHDKACHCVHCPGL